MIFFNIGESPGKPREKIMQSYFLTASFWVDPIEVHGEPSRGLSGAMQMRRDLTVSAVVQSPEGDWMVIRGSPVLSPPGTAHNCDIARCPLGFALH